MDSCIIEGFIKYYFIILFYRNFKKKINNNDSYSYMFELKI